MTWSETEHLDLATLHTILEIANPKVNTPGATRRFTSLRDKNLKRKLKRTGQL